jgi:hypothetical protein
MVMHDACRRWRTVLARGAGAREPGWAVGSARDSGNACERKRARESARLVMRLSLGIESEVCGAVVQWCSGADCALFSSHWQTVVEGSGALDWQSGS